jgi:hypothetical protein
VSNISVLLSPAVLSLPLFPPAVLLIMSFHLLSYSLLSSPAALHYLFLSLAFFSYHFLTCYPILFLICCFILSFSSSAVLYLPFKHQFAFLTSTLSFSCCIIISFLYLPLILYLLLTCISIQSFHAPFVLSL